MTVPNRLSGWSLTCRRWPTEANVDPCQNPSRPWAVPTRRFKISLRAESSPPRVVHQHAFMLRKEPKASLTALIVLHMHLRRFVLPEFRFHETFTCASSVLNKRSETSAESLTALRDCGRQNGNRSPSEIRKPDDAAFRAASEIRKQNSEFNTGFTGSLLDGSE